MKMRLLLACFLAFAGSASAQMVIKGTIAGADGLELYLMSEDGKTKDTVQLKADGAFSFMVHYKTNAEDLFALMLAGNPAPMLLLGEPHPIELTAQKNDFPVAQLLKAGQQTAWMQEYHRSFQPLIKKTQELNAEAAEIDGADDRATAAFRVKAKAFEEGLISTGTIYIKSHPKAHASLYVLVNELQRRISLEQFKALFNGLDPLVKNSRYGKVLAQQLAEAQ